MNEPFQREQVPEAVRNVLLAEWDPIGCSGTPEAQHEYDGYVGAVSDLVARSASQQEIFACLWEIETDYMGMAGDKPHTESVAKRLFEMGQSLEAD